MSTVISEQRGLLADKKREGRCSDDYFFFNVCVSVYRSVGFEGNIMYAKKGIIKKKVLVSLFRQTYRSFIYLQICEYFLWD